MTKSQKLLFELIKKCGSINDKTKLAKLEYFADFIHYAFNDKTISQEGIIYARQKQGPLARNLSNDIATLESEGYIIEGPKYNYTIKKDFVTDLSSKEKKTINFVAERYGKNSWSELVDISHKQSPYLSTKESAIIEFFTAYNLVDEYPEYATAS